MDIYTQIHLGQKLIHGKAQATDVPTIPEDLSSRWMEYDERTATTVNSTLERQKQVGAFRTSSKYLTTRPVSTTTHWFHLPDLVVCDTASDTKHIWDRIENTDSFLFLVIIW